MSMNCPKACANYQAEADPIAELDNPYLSYVGKIRKESAPMGVKFRNFWKTTVTIYWDDGTYPGVYNGELKSLGTTSTNSYVGHKFRFIAKDESKEEVAYHQMETGKNMYFVNPKKGSTQETSRFFKSSKADMKRMEDYYTEHGTPWLADMKRKPPDMFMWPADRIGQKHSVTVEGHSTCKESKGCVGEDIDLEFTAISTKPRVFHIPNVLSEFEVEHLVEMGEKKVHRSAVGGDAVGSFTSDTRTSSHGWLNRGETPVATRLFARFAKMMNISEEQLNRQSEPIQIVRYDKRQAYSPHHDFFENGTPRMRFITMLLYLVNPEKGGGTSFPKAYGGRGVKVNPPSGHAILFYNGLPDGNADDLALHAGLMVEEGVKWLCNIWVWDPTRA